MVGGGGGGGVVSTDLYLAMGHPTAGVLSVVVAVFSAIRPSVPHRRLGGGGVVALSPHIACRRG